MIFEKKKPIPIDAKGWYTISDLENKMWFLGGQTRRQIVAFILDGSLKKVRNVGTVKNPIYRIKGDAIIDFLK